MEFPVFVSKLYLSNQQTVDEQPKNQQPVDEQPINQQLVPEDQREPTPSFREEINEPNAKKVRRFSEDV